MDFTLTLSFFPSQIQVVGWLSGSSPKMLILGFKCLERACYVLPAMRWLLANKAHLCEPSFGTEPADIVCTKCLDFFSFY